MTKYVVIPGLTRDLAKRPYNIDGSGALLTIGKKYVILLSIF